MQPATQKAFSYDVRNEEEKEEEAAACRPDLMNSMVFIIHPPPIMQNVHLDNQSWV
jgi:hypothetical protein